jgi:primosomal protein N' (replication factor Y)
MIAKGLHFPNVTLVGVLNADLSLHIPDFRAGERTFQLLTQVSGRAGRGDVEGEVFIQSFTPFHPAIQFARRHDFAGFYDAEIEFRAQLNYPPVARIALITVRGRHEEKVRLSIRQLRHQLDEVLGQEKNTAILGPAPAPLERAEGYYRHQLMIRTGNMTRTSGLIRPVLLGIQLPEGVQWSVDIDPSNLA